MATPEDYGINVEQLVDKLAIDEGISIDTPLRVTPSTAKALARDAVREAFKELADPAKPNLPERKDAVVDTENPFSQFGNLRSMDDPDSVYMRLQYGLALREAAGEIGGEMPDLVGPNIPDARIRSSHLEGERTA